MPIQINKLKALINYINEENKIISYFEKIYWESNYDNLIKYKNKANIDYTLIPENLQFYSGFFLQVCYSKDKTILPLIEGVLLIIIIQSI